jgi:hypothetical protein
MVTYHWWVLELEMACPDRLIEHDTHSQHRDGRLSADHEAYVGSNRSMSLFAQSRQLSLPKEDIPQSENVAEAIFEAGEDLCAVMVWGACAPVRLYLFVVVLGQKA